jgi:DNA-binding transcriptional ArsR family regulator
MANIARFAEVASLAAEPARASMLHALMDGRALTAAELARAAGVTPQTASGHLARLVEAGMLAAAKQGRHRYHRLASPAVAQVVEGIMRFASHLEGKRPAPVTGPRDAALRAARTCYDHLAGQLGVAIADALQARGHVELTYDAGLVTESGLALFAHMGVNIGDRQSGKRMLCKPCLDWSERRAHLAGALGAALCSQCFQRGWISRVEGTRAVAVTGKGRDALNKLLGIAWDR